MNSNLTANHLWLCYLSENKNYNLIYEKNNNKVQEIKNKMRDKALQNWKLPGYRERIVKFQNEGKQTEEFHKKRSDP